MKIAFVSQPWERALPPSSSVPIWTYEVARRIAPACNVVVYARREADQKSWMTHAGIHYRLLSRAYDRGTVPMGEALAKLSARQSPLFASSLYHLAYILWVAYDLRAQQCDIVHVHNFAQFVPIIRAFHPKSKIVLHMHCGWLTHLDATTTMQRISKTDLVISCSDYLTNQTRQRFPELAERFHTVFNGVDTERFQKPHQAPAEHGDVKRLLFVGRVSPEKGVHVLTEAFSQVVKQYPNVHLDIIGPPWEAPYEFIAALGTANEIAPLKGFYDGKGYLSHIKARLTPEASSHVTFVGQVTQAAITKHYHEADLLVAPSVVAEGFGMPLIEAMASEVPVIASRAGGMIDVVDEGTTGVLVAPNQASTLAEAIIKLLKDDQARQTMGKAGHQRVLEHFSWEKVAQSLLSCYHRLIPTT